MDAKKSQHKRRKYLIQPRIQLLLGVVFLSTSALYVLLQAILLNWNMAQLASRAPADSQPVIDELLSSLRTNLWVTFVLMVPLTMSIGVYVTHRIVGPLYRFEQYFRELLAGGDPGELKIRKTDEFQELASLIGEVTRPLRPGAAAIVGIDVDDVPSLVPTSSEEALDASA